MTKKHALPQDNFFILNEQYLTLDDFLPGITQKTLELDLGCGKGDFAVALAARYPERIVFAADVMMGRLRKVARKSERNQNPGNLFFFRVEARHLVSIILPDNSLDRLHLLCPDPWPKAKHKGHRLLSSDFMMQIARVLKPGGVFHFATDDVPYLEQGVANIKGSGLFREGGEIADVSDIKTEFERQWLAEGKAVTHTAWTKIG
jgi:tRNA (guanine-N7-)-methyltransferase